ncbi:MAG: ATP-binding cassette domain-containing protein [bacterium]|nr:ATP-binding cassette domain-containing protein [bacterium]MDE0215515.1 ATP-binding cassette domain-containing protein [bacterium]
MSEQNVLLACQSVSAGYGELAVIRELDLSVAEGEIVALIGPNGAGKTTTLLTLAGELSPLQGCVEFMGKATSSPMHIRCSQGMGFITEERSVIMDMTARDNLRLADVSIADATDLFPELIPLLGCKAGLLSGGEQQMLTLARVLGRRPKVLLADELSLGLAPLIVTRLLAMVRRAADNGVGVLLVEQHVRQALAVADRVLVMQRGRIAIEGTSREIQAQIHEIEEAYLSSFD